MVARHCLVDSQNLLSSELYFVCLATGRKKVTIEKNLGRNTAVVFIFITKFLFRNLMFL